MSAFRRFGLVFSLIAAFAMFGCADPPDKEMQLAQGAIDAARAAGAERYARDEFSAAQNLLKQSYGAVEQGDYRLALNYALDSHEQAQNAAKQAADNKASARVDADHAISAVDAARTNVRAKLKAAESVRSARGTVARARQTVADVEAAVQKARAAFDRTDYLAVSEALAGTTERLQAAARDLEAATSPPARRRR